MVGNCPPPRKNSLTPLRSPVKLFKFETARFVILKRTLIKLNKRSSRLLFNFSPVLYNSDYRPLHFILFLRSLYFLSISHHPYILSSLEHRWLINIAKLFVNNCYCKIEKFRFFLLYMYIMYKNEIVLLENLKYIKNVMQLLPLILTDFRKFSMFDFLILFHSF